jgi:phage-related protein
MRLLLKRARKLPERLPQSPHPLPLQNHFIIIPGVAGLRVRGEDGQFRAFYFTASEEGILVVHAFARKTQQTPPADIKLARKRLKEMLDDQ